MKNEELARLAQAAKDASDAYAAAVRVHSRFPESFPDGTVLKFHKRFEDSSFVYSYAALLIHTDCFGPWWYLTASPRGKTFPRLTYDELKKFIGEEAYQILVPIAAEKYFTAVQNVRKVAEEVIERNNQRLNLKSTDEVREMKKAKQLELVATRPHKQWATTSELGIMFPGTSIMYSPWWKEGLIKRRELARPNGGGIVRASKYEYYVPTARKLAGVFYTFRDSKARSNPANYK